MFDSELESLSTQIRERLTALGALPPERDRVGPGPFSGTWGFGTAVCFQAAAAEARAGKAVRVPERAASLAADLAAQPPGP